VTTHGILDAQTSVRAEFPTPLRIDLPFEVERPLLVCHIPGRDHECEADPEEQGVDGKKGAVVKEDTGVADQAGEDNESCGDGGDWGVSAGEGDVNSKVNLEWVWVYSRMSSV
jgi:hypothetical protein